MSRNPPKRYQAQLLRRELDEWIDRWRFEIRAESTQHHLRNVGTVCALLYEKWCKLQGYQTAETKAYADQIDDLAVLSERMWEAEPLMPVVKARPSLRVV